MAAPLINQGLQPDFTAQYSSTLELLLQQETSVLRPFINTQGGIVGKMASPVTQYASVTMKAPAGRFARLDHVQPTSIRPWMFPQPGELTELIDNFDQLQTIVDPTTGYVRVASAATARYWDDGIITQATGTRQVGTDIANLVPQIFSTTNFQVASTFGSSSASGLTVAKIIEARRILRHYHNNLEADPPFLVIGSQQEADLLNQVQVVSTEFNERPVLTDGRIQSFLGFKFAVSERLSVAASVRTVFCAVKSGITLGLWQDMQTRITRREDLSGTPWQIYTSTMFGPTRTQEGKVVSILCSDSSGQDITP